MNYTTAHASDCACWAGELCDCGFDEREAASYDAADEKLTAQIEEAEW